MKRSSEEAIGRVLAGLRNTRAAAGMEQRILEAVERRATAPPASWFGRPGVADVISQSGLYGMRTAARGLALGGLLAVVALSFMNRRIHPSAHIAPHPGIQAGLQVPSSPAQSSPSIPAHGDLPPQMPARHIPVSRSTRAVNQPAPVAPLTEEEKLLLLIAHTGDPREMAMLNPEIRSQQAADAETQFRRFVEQSSKGDHE